MTDVIYYLMLASMFAVLVVLVIGLGGFTGGGAFNKKHGNKLMRLRLALQAIAVLLIVIYVAVK
jgi:hypothetical protein